MIYHQSDGQLMAVEVDGGGDSFRIGRVRPLFSIQPPMVGGPFFSATADAQRFLIVPGTVTQADMPLNLVVNWPEQLGRR